MGHDADTISPRNGGPGSNSWEAQSSLKNKNNGLRISEEETPLLGNGSSDGDGHGDAPKSLEWEGAADFANMPWWKTPSMYWLLPNFFLFALAFGGIVIPKLNLILTLVCREYLFERSELDPTFIFAPVVLDGENDQCRIPEVQALVSKFTLYMTVIVGCCSAIMAPKLGALSDRYGRKKFMVISSAGLFMTEIITILVYKYPDMLHYRWLLLGSILDGLSGSFTVGMALTYAYAADCTPPPKRAIAFGYFHACLFSGIALGPLLAAFFINIFGNLIVIFYVALGVHTFYICFIAFIVPESLTMKRQIIAREKYAAEGERESVIENLALPGNHAAKLRWVLKRGNIFKPLKILWPTGPGSSSRLRINLLLLSSVDTIIFGIAMGGMTVIIYYMGFQFDWKITETSEYMSIVNTVRVLGLVVILPSLNFLVRTRRARRQRRESGFAIPERNSGSDTLDLSVIRAAIFLETLGFLGFTLARTGSLFLAGGILAAFGGVGSPTLQSALTKHVPQDKVGHLLGAMALLHALARIVAPIFFNLIYAATVGTFPQAIFVVLTSCFGVAFIVSWFIKPHVYLEDVDETTGNYPASQPTAGTATSSTIVDEEVIGI